MRRRPVADLEQTRSKRPDIKNGRAKRSLKYTIYIIQYTIYNFYPGGDGFAGRGRDEDARENASGDNASGDDASRSPAFLDPGVHRFFILTRAP